MSEHHPQPVDLLGALRRELLRLARQEEELAATQASRVPYWSPTPMSVVGHRAAAAILRENAEHLSVIHTYTTAA